MTLLNESQRWEPERFEQIMDNWRRWMKSDVPVDAFPERSAVLSTGGASKSFDDMCIELDQWLAETTNAAIESLPVAESCALHHCYLQAVYRFNKLDYLSILAHAKLNLIAGLKSRNVYL